MLPLELVGDSSDHRHMNWGRVVLLKTRDDYGHKWVIPAECLLGDGNRALEMIANRGGRIEPGMTSAVLRYLNSSFDLDGKPLPRLFAESRTGWHRDFTRFVLPGRVIGGGEDVIYQSRSIVAAVAESGSLEEWQHKVAAPLAGNSRLAFALSVSFAAPMLSPLGHSEGCIFHCYGPSSVGKTTALDVAGSVWGGGDHRGFSHNWNTTLNGLEGIAEAHNHLVLPLDEIGQCSADNIGPAAYKLASGQGRGRALADGSGAERRSWILIVLSSGEMPFEDKKREAKNPQRHMGGEAVRFIDMAADAEKGFGIFDFAPAIEGKPDASHRERGWHLADCLKAAIRSHYGVAGPEFIEKFIEDRDSCVVELHKTMEAIVQKVAPPDADGQVLRVAKKFALVGAAGELAASFGILPWPAGEAARAAEVCFKDWLSRRGTSGASEIDDAINHLRALVERDGAAKFQRPNSAEPVRDRLGYIKRDAILDRDGSNVDLITYLILPQAWKAIMAGRDHERIARDLVTKNILLPGEGNRTQRKVRLPHQQPQRFYVIPHAALFAEPEDDTGGRRGPVGPDPRTA